MDFVANGGADSLSGIALVYGDFQSIRRAEQGDQLTHLSVTVGFP
jgi:hypothetical protein